MKNIKKTLIASSIISVLSMNAMAQDIPESLMKKENAQDTKNQEERIIIENKPVDERPTDEERIIIENKPVDEIPATDENREKLNKETKIEKNTRLAINFSYRLNEYNVKTCYEPLSNLVRSFARSPNLEDLELRSTLIESDKTEPVVFMDYAIVAKEDPQYSSINLSLQAIPYEDKNTCLLIETKDTILNNVESCEPLLAEADNSDNPAFVDEGTFENPFGKNKYFRKYGNQLLTLNDIKEGGCHVRSVSYSQYVNPETDNDTKDDAVE
jgi:hypothetical protein